MDKLYMDLGSVKFVDEQCEAPFIPSMMPRTYLHVEVSDPVFPPSRVLPLKRIAWPT